MPTDEQRAAAAAYGTAEHPVRISSLPALLGCPRRAMLDAMLLRDDQGSAAADTGTLTGAAIELWHRVGDIHAAWEQAIARGTTPQADEGKARAYLEGYCSDPRNAAREADPDDNAYGAVVNESLELRVELAYGGVHFVGHLDQVRRLGGRLYVWDVKCTSRLSGPAATSYYALQLAGYTLALADMLDEDVQVGGIIRATDYYLKAVREGGERPVAFYRLPLSIEQCQQMLGGVVHAVREVRTGDAYPIPSDVCSWGCVGGPTQCLDLG